MPHDHGNTHTKGFDEFVECHIHGEQSAMRLHGHRGSWVLGPFCFRCYAEAVQRMIGKYVANPDAPTGKP